MPVRIVPDQNQPSASIEIPLEKPLPDYDLRELEFPTPRDVDGVLASQCFRDLLDDARGVLMEILARAPEPSVHSASPVLDITHPAPPPLELAQLTGAICPGDDEVYRPGIWFVLRDPHATPKAPLGAATRERIAAIAAELAKRLQLE